MKSWALSCSSKHEDALHKTKILKEVASNQDDVGLGDAGPEGGHSSDSDLRKASTWELSLDQHPSKALLW